MCSSDLKERLQAEMKELQGEVGRLENKLANENFVNKAPQKVVDGERDKLLTYQKQLEETRISLQNLEEMTD